MRVDEIAEWCGFDSVWDMVTHYLDDTELMELLKEYIEAGKNGWIQEMIEDWAKTHYDWVDHEAIKAAHEDTKYEEWKDSRGERDER